MDVRFIIAALWTICMILCQDVKSDNRCWSDITSQTGNITVVSGSGNCTTRLRIKDATGIHIDFRLTGKCPAGKLCIKIFNGSHSSIWHDSEYKCEPVDKQFTQTEIILEITWPGKTAIQYNLAWAADNGLKSGSLNKPDTSVAIAEIVTTVDSSDSQTDISGAGGGIEQILEQFSKIELIGISLGSGGGIFLITCFLFSLCKRGKRSRKQRGNVENGESGKDQTADRQTGSPEKDKATSDAHRNPSTWKRFSKESIYDEIGSDLLSKNHPKTSTLDSGYTKMSLCADIMKTGVDKGHATDKPVVPIRPRIHDDASCPVDEKNERTRFDDQRKEPVKITRVSQSRRSHLSKLKRLSSLLRNKRRTVTDDQDCIGLDDTRKSTNNESDVKSIKRNRLFLNRKRKFLKIKKGQWLEDSSLWVNI